MTWEAWTLSRRRSEPSGSVTRGQGRTTAASQAASYVVAASDEVRASVVHPPGDRGVMGGLVTVAAVGAVEPGRALDRLAAVPSNSAEREVRHAAATAVVRLPA